MRANNLRKIWAGGGAVINGWCSIPSSFSAEVMAHQGFDSVTVDLQHGIVHYDTAVPMFQAISTTDTMPMARVPWLEEGIIMKILDAGAYGVICPMINTREEAERLVGACRYPPKGYRSFGPARASMYGGPDYAKKANDTILVFAMIETQAGLTNLDEILSVEGLDAVYVGPSDLGLALGGEPKLDQTDPKVVEAIGHILATCKKHGVRAGIHCASTDYAAKMIRDGFDLVTLSVDYRILAVAAAEMVKKMR